MFFQIDWVQFKPIASFLGGLLIGTSAVLLLAFKGRILGISGPVGSLMQINNTPKDHYIWRLSFISGILISPWIANYFDLKVYPEINNEYLTLILGGLLVGFGTRMGSGCTSGHAVCGIARLSHRSILATLIFMGSGFLTAYIFYNLI